MMAAATAISRALGGSISWMACAASTKIRCRVGRRAEVDLDPALETGDAAEEHRVGGELAGGGQQRARARLVCPHAHAFRAAASVSSARCGVAVVNAAARSYAASAET